MWGTMGFIGGKKMDEEIRKKDEIVQFLVDLEIEPRVEIGDIGLNLIFSDGDINLALDRLTIDEKWVIDRYDKVMDELNKDVFDPIFEKVAKSEISGEPMLFRLNTLIEMELNRLKNNTSLELYIAELMLDVPDV